MTYRKRKKITQKAYNKGLISICDELHKYNDDAIFVISKNFIEKPDKTLGDEINKPPVIISSVPIKELIIPSSLKLDSQGNITTWCDEMVLIRLVYKEIIFSDGEINGKTIRGLHLEIKEAENCNVLLKTR